MAFPDHFLDEVKARVPLAQVVGRVTRLVRRGREHTGPCPFHQEKTPSFTVNETKGFYHCFGCGAHGSIFDFVMRTEGLSFREAVAKLAAEAGLSLPVERPEDVEREKRQATLHDVLERAAAFYERALRLPEGKPALDYLKRRGLDDATIGRFRLGFAPDGRGAMKAALMRDGASEALLIEAGLLIQPEDGSRSPYERFRGRVMFPIADRRGRIVGFGGRVLGSGEPKYLNTPETPLFHKGRLLYGLNHAMAAAQNSQRLILVEGYMDVIGLSAAGYTETVAPLGTALTEDQLKLLWHLAPEPILCFDPDRAGRQAAVRALDRVLPLLRSGNGLRFAFLHTDSGDDPDAVARRYQRQFLDRAFAEALPLSDFVFHVESGGAIPRTAEGRAALDQRLAKRIAAVADVDMRRHLRAAFRERMWRDPRRPRAGNRRGAAASPPATVTMAPAPPRRREEHAETHLLAAVLRHPEAFPPLEEAIGTLSFADPALERLRQALIDILSASAGPAASAVLEGLARRGLDEAAARILDDPTVRIASAIAADAEVGDVVAYGRAQLAILRDRALRRELASLGRDETLSPAAWAERRALIEARLTAADEG